MTLDHVLIYRLWWVGTVTYDGGECKPSFGHGSHIRGWMVATWRGPEGCSQLVGLLAVYGLFYRTNAP